MHKAIRILHADNVNLLDENINTLKKDLEILLQILVYVHTSPPECRTNLKHRDN
jgi:hypothetical protein